MSGIVAAESCDDDTFEQLKQQMAADKTQLQLQIESMKQQLVLMQQALSALQQDSARVETVGNTLKTVVHDLQDQRHMINKAVDSSKMSNFITFSAYATAIRSYNDGQMVQFDSVVINMGAHYDPSTSVFTCPVSGYYLLSLHVRSIGDEVMYADIVTGGTVVAGVAADRDYDSASNTVVVYCAEGADVFVRARSSGCVLQGDATFAYSMFTGTLLSIEQA